MSREHRSMDCTHWYPSDNTVYPDVVAAWYRECYDVSYAILARHHGCIATGTAPAKINISRVINRLSGDFLTARAKFCRWWKSPWQRPRKSAFISLKIALLYRIGSDARCMRCLSSRRVGPHETTALRFSSLFVVNRESDWCTV